MGIAVILVASVGAVRQTTRFYHRVNLGEDLAAAAQRYQSPIASEQRVLLVGDSIAYGVGVQDPLTSVAAQLDRALPDHAITNRSEIGATVADVGPQVGAPGDADVVVVVAGGNDVVRPSMEIDESVAQLGSLLQQLAETSNLVVYVPPVDFEFVELLPGFSRSFFSDRSKRLRSGASTISAATDNVVVLELTELTGAEFARLLAADGFHLNESGSAALADEIAAVVASRPSEQP
jgi:lysophospholipase L1-like esterase